VWLAAATGKRAAVSEQRIAAVRRFNRFYTRQIGVLQEGLLQSPFSLTEARVLYELATRPGVTASELAADLGLDPGYLSRILRGFGARGLITRTRSKVDGRQSHLRLTEHGAAVFAPLDRASRGEVGALLARLSEPRQSDLLRAMGRIEAALGAGVDPAYSLRPHRPGDMGWVVHRHGALYAEEYGWDERFEALVAGIVAQFVERYRPARERCWIAEQDGLIVGSVFLVEHSAEVAKLRLLLVEPWARGQGIGARLVQECERFARDAGYRTITLWTNSVLHAARHLYEKAGYLLVREEPHHSFGHDLVGETWELVL
jgi:DNA-binding MarR family transcriptional regulator/N-acetylglutamate synthase-like GNAT family acetyltransferase